MIDSTVSKSDHKPETIVRNDGSSLYSHNGKPPTDVSRDDVPPRNKTGVLRSSWGKVDSRRTKIPGLSNPKGGYDNDRPVSYRQTDGVHERLFEKRQRWCGPLGRNPPFNILNKGETSGEDPSIIRKKNESKIS